MNAEMQTPHWKHYLLATRPPFLLAAAVPVLIGNASAWHDDITLQPLLLVITLLAAILIHAAANVLNDYYDARNGTDALNEDYLHPYTGGSRFIQNGILSQSQTLGLALLLLSAASLCGLWLVSQTGQALLWLGLGGVLMAWGYSGPPLDLNRRGLGELSLALCFGLLIIVGSDFIQRQELAWFPLLLSLPYGLLSAALLYINQFPDQRADALAGKRHWVVRLGVQRARWGYLWLVLIAHGYLAWMLLFGQFPAWLGLALLSAPLSLLAATQLLRHADQPRRLRPAIRFTLLALFSHGLLLSGGLLLAAMR